MKNTQANARVFITVDGGRISRMLTQGPVEVWCLDNDNRKAGDETAITPTIERHASSCLIPSEFYRLMLEISNPPEWFRLPCDTAMEWFDMPLVLREQWVQYLYEQHLRKVEQPEEVGP